ncbi:MFS general substrate transporter [Aulographum hederae CBS 113979]|uniref:MFS general substrate transporter n=1 Tax=Aulographum hederae CBS 113979 TaxID=1176131 RepID=A0A6G1GMI5_9PEZI|nr:MFS general substrate transporter [Aulographum hederae CBS 113979]
MARERDPLATKKLLWKCDWHLIPVLWVMFLLTFLDRSNIGNAKIQGLPQELNMKGNDYNVALFVFFIPYILFEVPSNWIIKKVEPSTWLSGIMVTFGICTIGQGLVNNLAGLVGLRFCVGFFEAGLFPGCIYLLSMYYKRYELQFRLTLFFSASIVAPAFGGLFAYALAKMDGIAGYSGWRWIFIIEGIATVLIGAISKFLIPSWPERATFLTDSERAHLLARLSSDTGAATMNTLNKRSVRRIVTDGKIYLGTLMYCGVVCTSYGGALFMPSIIKEMGYTSAAAQVRTIPIFMVALVVSLIVAVATDKLRHRYGFTMLGVAIATIGYIILLSQTGLAVGVKYFALFLVASGGFITQTVALGWLANCMSGHYKRSVSSASQVGFGNIGGIIASNIFLDKEAPAYKTGYSVSLGLLLMCGAACTALFVLLVRENRKRERGERDYRLLGEDRDNLGDDHPAWRFAT